MIDLYIDAATRTLSLADLKKMFTGAGADRLYFKALSPNDNSKNQIYVGRSPEDTRPIPTGPWGNEPSRSRKGSPTQLRYILRAPVRLAWLRPDGTEVHAPRAKLIMYPQYEGEYRLSGFLAGAHDRPSTLLDAKMRGREPGRILFLGTDCAGRVLAFLAPASSRVAREVLSDTVIDKIGVLEELALPARGVGVATVDELLTVLGDIHRLGWRDSRILRLSGPRACKGPQCIGQTLLAELGITADGRAVPDYRGWEVKAFTLKKLSSKASQKVTLMTPEPTGGFYAANGVEAFVRKYGSPARNPKKLYFEGKHVVDQANSKRGTTLVLEGYDAGTAKITDALGGLRLMDSGGNIAAEWGFAGLIEHWRNKHARAVFVAAISKDGTPKQFRYASKVHLAQGNPFQKLMDAFLNGVVWYDPGVRFDTAARGGAGESKARNQFRMSVPKNLPGVYQSVRLYTDVK